MRFLLLDSPVSRAGYYFATAVGLTWGFLCSTGRVERRNGLWVFTGMPKRAFGRGGSCVGSCYLTDSNVSDDVLEHEAVHKRQWQRYGMLFPLLYLVAGRDPLRNRFEIEAGLEKGGYLRRRRRPRANAAASSTRVAASRGEAASSDDASPDAPRSSDAAASDEAGANG